MIFEISSNSQGNILFKYYNPFTKKEFKKKIFYDGERIIGEVVWQYYKSRKLKSICGVSDEYKLLDNGNEVRETMFDCVDLDYNGCFISK